MPWMSDLKLAIIEEDSFRIGKLISCVPDFTELEPAKEALALIACAIEVVEKQQKELKIALQKVKQTKEFFLSDEAKSSRFIG